MEISGTEINSLIYFSVSVCLSFSQQGRPGPAGAGEFERMLKESQKEVLRLQRQLSVSSARDQISTGGAEKEREENETPVRVVSYFTAPPCGSSWHSFDHIHSPVLSLTFRLHKFAHYYVLYVAIFVM